MPVKVRSFLIITDEHANAARRALSSAGISATVRKGRGSCRWKFYVTPKDKSADHAPIVEAIADIGFTFKWRDSWDGKCHFEKLA